MPAALLQTKLYRPVPRSNLVPRTHLLERLDRGLASGARLILLSAPPGFGKTTLVTDWLGRTSNPSAWLALDSQDNDPVRFFTYLVSAFQTLSPGAGESLLSSLDSTQLPPLEPLLTLLINDLCTLSQDTLLVLDDYHAIDTPAIHTALAFLIDHLPPNVHIAITTRVDPPLPLARYRSRSQLVEIRTEDLRFTADEAGLFLSQVMGLELTAEDIVKLETRTEGWVVGLQMAALSIRGHADRVRFIQSFSGSNRYILDYLIEEVLSHQPAEIQNFLMQTSILDQLTGPLCDAVTQSANSHELLANLERENLFLVPADGERRWFRYHQLFRDLLLAQLQQSGNQEIPALHLRAADWFQENGMLAEAVPHALAAGDFGRAAILLERNGYSMLAEGLGLATFISWARAIPREELARHPTLCLRFAFVLFLAGQIEGTDSLIRQAEQQIRQQANLDTPEAQDQRALCAYVRAYYATATGDLPTAIEQAEQALVFVRPDDIEMRSTVLTQLGEIYTLAGELDEAVKMLREAIKVHERLGQVHSATVSYSRWAGILKAQGRLGAAADLYRRNFRLIEEHGDRPPGIIGVAEAGIADIMREQNQLPEALELLNQALEHVRILGKPYDQAMTLRVLAFLLLSQGDLRGVRDLVGQGEELAERHAGMPGVRLPIDLYRVRYWLAAGDHWAIAQWLREHGSEETAELRYVFDQQRLSLARVLIYENKVERGLTLLKRLEQVTETGGRTGRLIQVLVLQSLALVKVGRKSDALLALEKALVLGEPEGYARIFLDEGEAMQFLLRDLASSSDKQKLRGYAERLLQGSSSVTISFSHSQPAVLGVSEPLSPRELEVLQLIGQGLSNQEIADRLVISLRTVKKHIENIYGKLEVKNRSQAILRAQELELI